MTTHAPRYVGKESSILPANADGVTCTAGAAWVDGAYTEIDAGTGVPTGEFQIIGICLDTPSAAMIGEVEIASGAAGSEAPLLRKGFEVATDAGFIPTLNSRGEGLPVDGGTRIAALIATKAGAQTIGVKVQVQEV